MAVSSTSHLLSFRNRLLLLDKKKKKWNGALSQEKEYLFDQAMRTKKERNSKVSENKKLSVRCRYLEKELKQRETVIQELMERPLQYPAYSSPVVQSKEAMTALQKSYENNLVINLKTMIQDQKQQLANRDSIIDELKHDTRGSHLREVNAEKNAFEEEATRLRNILDDFINQIGGVERVLNFKEFLDQQQGFINELEGHKDTQQQIYDAKYDEWLKLEKKVIETEIERENGRKDASDKQKQIERKQVELENQVIEYRLLENKKKDSENSLKNKIKAIENVLSRREKEIWDLNDIIAERNHEITGNEQLIDNLQNTIVQKDKVISTNMGTIADRDQTIVQKNKEISGLHDDIRQLNQEHSNATHKLIKEHEEVVDNYKGQIDTFEKEIVGMINEKNNILEEQENLKVEHAQKLKENNKKHEEEKNELHEQLKEANNEVDKSIQKLTQEAIKYSQEKKEYENHNR